MNLDAPPLMGISTHHPSGYMITSPAITINAGKIIFTTNQTENSETNNSNSLFFINYPFLNPTVASVGEFLTGR
jgi:hypothetical protein